MNSVKPVEPDSLPLSPRFLCPYLGTHYDADTYSLVSALPNYCHKANPNAPVNIKHQVLACTSEEHKNCPVFLAPQPPVLPAEWLNVDGVTNEEAKNGPVFLAPQPPVLPAEWLGVDDVSEGEQVSQRRTILQTLTDMGIGLVALVRELPKHFHKANPNTPVGIERPVLASTSEETENGPVFLAPQPPVLPAEWLNVDEVSDEETKNGSIFLAPQPPVLSEELLSVDEVSESEKVSQRRTIFQTLTDIGIGLVAQIRELPKHFHKANPNAPVGIEHPVLASTSEEYEDSPAFLAPQAPVLPAEWLSVDEVSDEETKNGSIFLAPQPPVLPAEGLDVDEVSEGKQVNQRRTTLRKLTGIGIGLVALIRELPKHFHKANPNPPVSIEHPVLASTFEEYEAGPVFLAPQPPVRLAEWINVDKVPEGKKVSQPRTAIETLTNIGIGLVVLIILGVVYQGWFTGSAADVPVTQASNTPALTLYSTQIQQAINRMQTETATASQPTQLAVVSTDTQPPEATLTNCEVQIFPPVYSPAVNRPPLKVTYGDKPFLIKWKVVNTSADCDWTTMQLLTVVDGQPKLLSMMPPGRVQPVIDEEFVIRDERYIPVNRVDPGQTVTIVIQIDARDLVRNNGKIDRFCDMIVNGQLIPGGKLIALQEHWAVVIVSTWTPPAVVTATPPPH